MKCDFSLRVFSMTPDKDFCNVEVGKFKPIAQNVHEIRIPKEQPIDQLSFQIYPYHCDKRTFYTLEPGQFIYVFDAGTDKSTIVGQTQYNDEYIYFSLQSRHVIVIVADSEATAISQCLAN